MPETTSKRKKTSEQSATEPSVTDLYQLIKKMDKKMDQMEREIVALKNIKRFSSYGEFQELSFVNGVKPDTLPKINTLESIKVLNRDQLVQFLTGYEIEYTKKDSDTELREKLLKYQGIKPRMLFRPGESVIC